MWYFSEVQTTFDVICASIADGVFGLDVDHVVATGATLAYIGALTLVVEVEHFGVIFFII